MKRPAALGVLLYCALLAPMFRVSPGSGAAGAMEGGWVSPLLAFPVALAPLWVLVRLSRTLPEGAGLPKLYELALGKQAGRLVTALTGLWAVLVAAAALRFCGESIVATVYPDTSVWVFLLGILWVVWRAAGRGMAVLCRLAKAYLIIIGTVLSLVLVLSLREIRVEHLWPVWRGGWRGMLDSALPVLGVLSPMVPVLFHSGDAPGSMKGGRTLTLWLAASCLTMAAARAVVIGMFGWQTAARLQTPLFSAAKEVYLLEVFERIEALVVAVWVLSDIVFLSALLLVAVDYVERLIGRRCGTRTALALLLLLAAMQSGGDVYRLRGALTNGAQWVNLALCYALPLGAAGLARLRGRI